MDDLITVIINVYNTEKYIGRCIESVINQTYPNLEILIIDDGSTDNTLKICQSYKDSRIIIITQKNMGLSKSRNVGIDNSNGKYLYFVDADDFIEKDVIEYLYKLAQENDAPIATCRPIDIYNEKIIVKNQKEKVSIISNIEMLKKILLSVDRAGTIWNKLIKKELFDKFRFEDRIINDVVVIYKIVLSVDKIVYSNQQKYYYYHHNESILGKKRPEHSIDLYKASIERYDYIKERYPNLIENEICLAYVIMILYLPQNPKVQEFLTQEDSLNLYKKMFSIKIVKCRMKFREKVKMILFRIHPKLCYTLVNKYLNIKNKRSTNNV